MIIISLLYCIHTSSRRIDEKPNPTSYQGITCTGTGIDHMKSSVWGLFFLDNFFFFLKFLLDRGAFCGSIGTLCIGLWMTLPMSFNIRVDQSSPALFCHLCTMFPRVISGCWDWASNPDCLPLRRT